MPIIHDGKNIVDRLHGGAPLVKKYHGDKLVWVKNIKRRLPMGYQEVEYLESNGKQGITTNIYSNQDTVVKIDFENALLENNFLVGGRNGQISKRCLDVFISSKLTVDFADSTARRVTTSISLGRHIVTITKDKATLDDKSVSFDTSLGSFVSEVPLCIAYSKDFLLGDNKPMKGLVGKVYSCVVYQGDNCVGNFVPCYRKSDHKSGMYDTITNTFFISATSTDFFVGADVKCKKLEYCENLNGNYIDLRMKLKSSYKTKVDFQVPQTDTENRGVIFGTRGTNTDTLVYSLDKSYGLINWTKINNTPVTVDVWNVYQGDGAKRRYTISESDRYKRLLVEISDTAIKVDDTTVKTNTPLTEFETVKSACIFGSPLVRLSTTESLAEYTDVKIYSVEIKDKTDNLLFSLIPYQIGDTVGMLDTLSKVFFTGELVGKPFVTKQSRSR